jgi:hypothetical protein
LGAWTAPPIIQAKDNHPPGRDRGPAQPGLVGLGVP